MLVCGDAEGLEGGGLWGTRVGYCREAAPAAVLAALEEADPIDIDRRVEDLMFGNVFECSPRQAAGHVTC